MAATGSIAFAAPSDPIGSGWSPSSGATIRPMFSGSTTTSRRDRPDPACGAVKRDAAMSAAIATKPAGAEMTHRERGIDFTVEVLVVSRNRVLLRKHEKYGIWL